MGMHNGNDASPFIYSLEMYEKEFENILIGITACYQMMIEDNVLLPNNENKIRDILRKDYLNKKQIRDCIGFTGKYNFDREVPEDNDRGRVDIKIITQNTLEEPEAYYIIECKRLDSQKLLRTKYIEDGIKRFVEEKYSACHGINGMIGFVVKQMDICANIANINNLLENNFAKVNTETVLTSLNFIENFKYQYYSIHKDIKDKRIKLYHLMFDFSGNMEGQ
ncbi:MAG: hypothetical protein ABH870_00055 [bacterium]